LQLFFLLVALLQEASAYGHARDRQQRHNGYQSHTGCSGYRCSDWMTTPGAVKPFHVIILASDPQFDSIQCQGVDSEKSYATMSKEQCVYEGGSHKEKAVMFMDKVKTLTNHYNAEKVVINGDMTEYGWPKEKNRFTDNQPPDADAHGNGRLHVNLGNHDVGNNIDNCNPPQGWINDIGKAASFITGRRHLKNRLLDKMIEQLLAEIRDEDDGEVQLAGFWDDVAGAFSGLGASIGHTFGRTPDLFINKNGCAELMYQYAKKKAGENGAVKDVHGISFYFDVGSRSLGRFRYIDLQNTPYKDQSFDTVHERRTIDSARARTFFSEAASLFCKLEQGARGIFLIFHIPCEVDKNDHYCDSNARNDLNFRIWYHNMVFPNCRVQAIFNGHLHGQVGRYSKFDVGGARAFVSGGAAHQAMLSMEVDYRKKHFKVRAHRRASLDAGWTEAHVSDNGKDSPGTYYCFNGEMSTNENHCQSVAAEEEVGGTAATLTVEEYLAGLEKGLEGLQ